VRWLRLIFALVTAKFKSKINLYDTSTLFFRVWITDIDVSVMNHAALLTVMEMGRIDLMVRTNFFEAAAKEKWYFPSQGISVQFYRPLKAFQKAELHTKILFIDEDWIYVQQKVLRNGKAVAACLVKGIVKKGRDKVPTSEIMTLLGFEKHAMEKPELISSYELESKQMNEKFFDQL
jgi:acyl-CoA thioesterase FadM